MKKCSVCKKNIAMLFASTYENGKPEMKGLCLNCAKKMNIPGIDDLIKQTGMSEEELSAITDQMNDSMSMFDEDSEMDFLSNFKDADKEDEIQIEENEEAEAHQDEVEDKEPSKKKKKKKKYLDTFGTNLTDKASKNQIDKVIGRDKEIQRVIQILNRRAKNNPVLVGEPGVGKTAIAEGLAVRIAEKQVPSKLLNAEVYLLDMTAVVAGTQFRGQFEGRMKSIITEAQSYGNIILVIDELHNIMGAGEVHGGTMNAANILKPALARGDVQIIGATTLSEYRKHIEKDSALERRFQPVMVDEPSEEESIEILKGIKGYYEDYHQVSISDEVIEAAVKMSNRYITDRFLPDKAIDVIDEAGSRANLVNEVLTSIEDYKTQLMQSTYLKDQASEKGDFEGAAYYKAEEIRLTQKIELLEKSAKTPLTIEDVAHIIEAWTKIPLKSITEEEAIKLLNLEQRLHQRVIGQDEAISSISRTVRRNRSGFRKRRKPASFIFVGPTGVGKTEVVRALAKEMFGSEDDMIRIDMSEYMERHTVSKLIGSPPGYVGYDEGGQLTEKVRRRPYSVILFDEIEKAHADVFNMLLQILEDGRLTDAQGRTVFFENTIIVMTSNAGTSYKSKSMGFGNANTLEESEHIKDALKEVFRPEFLNRVDDIVVFTRLSKPQLREIVDLMIKEVQTELAEKGISLHVSDEVKEFLLEKGYDDKYGARPLRRVIQRYIEDEISELYLRKEILDKDSISAIMLNAQVSIVKSHE
ncbi:protein disaggregation chaperone [Acetoanaerobium sticklandii]|uniref:Protein disaggregation chaperone n=1 Tax=Acetoanaerobium sticklandii (strain ATCC 12662 / DSM 519 / JCM 1433 / CCUG 9281 / NCIMB 10654 / HF) TaxID=499177 RepID=E3PU42_ACESD|nr:ATP-dependent Clp protease ATP-binding subunit [Acetoanaerobium sticklandii]CBH20303.1 protein disaggregation chaperone [Acetoanaerobium sticklandii]